MKRAYTCKHCGNEFTISAYDAADIEEGFCQAPEMCDECFEMQESAGQEIDEFSDADPGL